MTSLKLKNPILLVMAAAVATVLCNFADAATDTAAPVVAQSLASSAETISAKSVLESMQKVADWQLANPSAHPTTDWTQGVGYAGMMALAGLSGDHKYRNAMLVMGEKNGWKLGPETYFADDHTVGQTYAELYLQLRDPRMIAPMRAQFDEILKNPAEVPPEFHRANTLLRWIWCDALFMAPPTWMRLYAATGDQRYLDMAVKSWWQVSDYMYDKQEHLYFRDSTYFKAREANGKKVFWSRGNGWVMAGLARVLQYLPAKHTDRPRFERQFRDMAAKVATLQQSDGMWRSSLLDPGSYPAKETSGTGLYTYALTWGVNQGLLDRARFEPVVRRAWRALNASVQSDGKLIHVQPIGQDPKTFAVDSTDTFGVGAFLLAGSEVYRMAVLEKSAPRDVHIVTITNTSNFRRDEEIVEAKLAQPGIPVVVMDASTSRILDSQVIDNKLLFQVDLAAGDMHRYLVLPAGQLAAVPPADVKTAARFVPERLDDFSWENDRIAHRLYGPAIKTAPGQIANSGVDVWVKSVRYPVADKWYKRDDYHVDHGEGVDNYDVGASRGCGGVSIVDGTATYNSSVYTTWKVLANGPLRSVFEVTYDGWNAGDRKVAETARISIDAGSNFSRVESVFTSDRPDPLLIGVGIAQRKGEGHLMKDEAQGILSYWEPEMAPNGSIACSVLIPGNATGFLDASNAFAQSFVDKPKPVKGGEPPTGNYFALGKAAVGTPFVYYLGAGWSKSGDFPASENWDKYVRDFALRLKSPLVVAEENSR